ncbi:MAG: hypothetical protein ISP83_07130 [Candidatus Poseidonia sp.]|nr:hypothetical protein [Poseidonia sp.]
MKRSSTRRRTTPKTNLSNIAVSAIVANAITEGVFQSNIVDFFTGRTDGVFKAGADGSYRLTLPELLGLGAGGIGGNYSKGYDFQKVVMDNIKKNFVPMMGTVIIAPMVANVVKKTLRKPVILPANRLLKNTLGMNVKLG